MLALAGIPGTVGFIGKFQLIHALVDGGYTWLAIVLVVGSMISLGYYLRVVATMWMGAGAGGARPAGASCWRRSPAARRRPRSRRGPCRPTGWPAARALAGPSSARRRRSSRSCSRAACVFFGIFPSPLFHFAAHAGHALSGLF